MKNIQIPVPAEMRFHAVESDGIYADYHFTQRTPGGRVEWQLTHDLTDNTWSALVDHEEATQEQTDALLACLTSDQREDAEAEFREQHPTTDDTPSAPTM